MQYVVCIELEKGKYSDRQQNKHACDRNCKSVTDLLMNIILLQLLMILIFNKFYHAINTKAKISFKKKSKNSAPEKECFDRSR